MAAHHRGPDCNVCLSVEAFDTFLFPLRGQFPRDLAPAAKHVKTGAKPWIIVKYVDCNFQSWRYYTYLFTAMLLDFQCR